MKTILIPTDFSARSLDCIPALCEQLRGERICLIFSHFFKLSDSISDLLMLRRRSREHEYISREFYDQLDQIKLECTEIASIKIEFFYGSTIAMFKTFAGANDVSYILNSSDCSLRKIHKNSIDPAPLALRSGIPIISVSERTAVSKNTIRRIFEEV